MKHINTYLYVRKLISLNRVDEAVNEISSYVETEKIEDQYDTVALISRNYNDWKAKNKLSTKKFDEDLTAWITRISYSILGLLGDLFPLENVYFSQTAKVNYIIGIDLGDGESSISYTHIYADTPPIIYQNKLNNSVFLTAYSTDPLSQGILIGKEALLKGHSDFSINFKSDPKNPIGWDHSRLSATNFLHELLNRFFKETALSNFNKDNTQLYLGRPSGWNDSSAKIYGEAISKAVGIKKCETVSESLCALIGMTYDKGKIIEKTNLVIDIGSSTTDIILISYDETLGKFSESRESNLYETGGNIGLNIIDKAIYDWSKNEFLKANPNSSIYFDTDSLKNIWQYVCRLVKENIFSDNNRNILRKNLKTSNPSIAKLVEDCISITSVLTENSIINLPTREKGVTWSQLFEKFISNIKKEIPYKEIGAVYLTGGGSRMNINKRIISRNFEIDKLKLITDPSPSHSVAKGLSLYGKYKYELDIKETIESIKKDGDFNFKIEAIIRKFIKVNEKTILKSIFTEIWITILYRLRDNYDKFIEIVKWLALVDHKEYKNSVKSIPNSKEVPILAVLLIYLVKESLADKNIVLRQLVNNLRDKIMLCLKNHENRLFDSKKEDINLDVFNWLDIEVDSLWMNNFHLRSKEIDLDFVPKEITFESLLNYLYVNRDKKFDKLRLSDLIDDELDDSNLLSSIFNIFIFIFKVITSKAFRLYERLGGLNLQVNFIYNVMFKWLKKDEYQKEVVPLVVEQTKKAVLLLIEFELYQLIGLKYKREDHFLSFLKSIRNNAKDIIK